MECSEQKLNKATGQGNKHVDRQAGSEAAVHIRGDVHFDPGDGRSRHSPYADRHFSEH